MRTVLHYIIAAIGFASLLAAVAAAPAWGQAIQVRGGGIATGTSISSETASGQRLISQVGQGSPVGRAAANGRTLRSGALFAFSARARTFVVERPGPVAPGTGATIRVEVDSPEPIVGAQLRYRPGGGGLETVEMTIEDGTVSGAIPASAITARGLSYFITFVDAAGAEFRAPREGVFSLNVSVEDGTIVRADPLPGGQSQGAYRLIALPLQLDNPDPRPFLTENLGSQDATDWRFFELIEDEDVREFPNTSDLLPGRGFWLIARASGIALEAGEGRIVDLDAPFTHDVRAGWNLIGNPFNFPLPIENLTLDNDAAFSLRSFGPSDWNNPISAPVTVLEPFEGYAFFNEGEATALAFDPEVAADEEALIAQGELPRVAWMLQLRAEVSAEAYATVVAGAAPDAASDWDRLDYPQPPSLFADVTLTFPRPDWDHPAERFSSDIRPAGTDGHVWPLELQATPEQAVRVRALGGEALPADWSAWLVNDATQTVHTLMEGPATLAGARAETPQPLRLVVGTEAFVADELGELYAPGAVTLDGGYPNPFRQEVRVRYGIPEEMPVRLQVFDTLGREIALLYDGDQTTGYHLSVWDGRSRSGAPVASGVYFVRLQAGGTTLTESVVRVR